MSQQVDSNADSSELEALFDSIAAASGNSEITSPEKTTDSLTTSSNGMHSAENCAADKVISQVGKLTRTLHESLRELGYDKSIQSAASIIPDAQERLSYVVNMTEQAASRALNAIETAKPLQEKLQSDSVRLSGQWERLFSNQLSVDEFKALAKETCKFLQDVPAQTGATNAQLTEIMMAQDFQDLTGQVIKRVTDLAQQIEKQLLVLLVENVAPDKKTSLDTSLINGPVINADGRSDVVTSQKQVDDLLESLGF
jgi:chemotaxis protein CheZ